MWNNANFLCCFLLKIGSPLVYNIQTSRHSLQVPMKGDFIVDESSRFEIGGEGKGFGQIKGIDDFGFLAFCIDLKTRR